MAKAYDYYGITGGHIAVVVLLAEETKDDPEELKRAKAKGYDQPYWVTVSSYLKRVGTKEYDVMSVKERNFMSSILDSLKRALAARDDLFEMHEEYADRSAASVWADEVVSKGALKNPVVAETEEGDFEVVPERKTSKVKPRFSMFKRSE